MLVLSGCGGSARPDHDLCSDCSAEERRLHVHVQLDTSPAKTWSTVLEWQLGETGPDAEESPGFVSGVALLSDGRLVATLPFDDQLLVSNGRTSERWGRRGGGPGEFTFSVARVTRCPGDTIAVESIRDITFFAPDGTWLRRTGLPAVSALGRGRVVGVATDCRAVLVETYGSTIARATKQPNALARLEWVSLVDSARSLIAEFPDPPEAPSLVDGIPTVRFRPYGPVPLHAPFPGGVVFGTTHAPEFRRLGPDGSLTQLVRWPDRNRAFGAEHEAAFERQRAEFLRISPGDRFPPIRELVPYPTVPAISQVLVDDRDQVWVRLFSPETPTRNFFQGSVPPAAATWLIFLADGRQIGTLRTPRGFEVRTISGDHLAGVRLSEDLEGTLEVHRLIRATAPPLSVRYPPP
jgi:hypothetical protein